MRSISTVSLLVLLAGLVALAGVPTLRHALLSALRPEFYDIDFGEIAREHPDDPDAWLAALPQDWYREIPIQERDLTYHRACTLAPHSAAPHFIYAGLALGGINGIALRRAEENAHYPDCPWALKIQERYLRESERERLRLAGEALERAAEMDPGNAAVDALRAAVALIEHEDARALELLRSSLEKSEWRSYRSDVSRAADAVALESLPPDQAALVGAFAYPDTLFNTYFRHLASVVVGFSILAEQRGDREEATLLRRSIMHLGLLMLGPGSSIGDGHTGWLVWGMAATLPLTDDERSEAKAAAELAETQLSGLSAGLARAGVVRKAESQKLAGRLREQGEEKLAAEVLALADSREKWYQQTRLATWESSRTAFGQMAIAFAVKQSGHALAVCLIALLLCGVGVVTLYLRGRPPRPIHWSPIGWVLVVYSCLAAAYLGGLFGPGGERLAAVPDVPGELIPAGWTCPAWGSYFAAVAVPLILASVAVVVVLHRGRHPEARSVGPVRHYLGTTAAVLLLLSALVCLVTIGFAARHGSSLREQGDTYRGILEQGELDYYGLGVTPPAPSD